MFFYCFKHNLDGVLCILMLSRLYDNIYRYYFVKLIKTFTILFILLKNLIILDKNIEFFLIHFVNYVFL